VISSLQVGAEAEGSGLDWGLDFGSGFKDLVSREELLRVSIKGDGNAHVRNREREGNLKLECD
jgi:hypothetical protein